MGDLNTTPRTWVAGEIPTAAQFNTELRDALAALQAPWVDYAAAWTASSSNPAIGNGTIDASYHRIGKTVDFLVKITMGSTTTYGSGGWRISLPFTAVTTRWRARLDVVAANSSYSGTAMAGTGTYVSLWVPPTTPGNPDRAVTGTVPGTFTTGDMVTVVGRYEAV